MPRHSSAINQEPVWRTLRQYRMQRLGSGLRRWLADRGSLTQGILRVCSSGFHVRVRGQQWRQPFFSEARLLSSSLELRAIIREVELCCDAACWVYARTVIPAGSLRGPARRLIRLGSRPLGALLFADPSSRRGLTQFATLLPGDSLYELAVSGLPVRPEQLQGRRTLFHFAGKPLLVNEVFLPGIPDMKRADNGR